MAKTTPDLMSDIRGRVRDINNQKRQLDQEKRKLSSALHALGGKPLGRRPREETTA